MRYQLATALLILMGFAHLCNATPLEGPNPSDGAIVEDGEFPPYDRLKTAGRTETLRILESIGLKLRASEPSSGELTPLLTLLEPLIVGEDEEISLAALYVLSEMGPHVEPLLGTLREISFATDKVLTVRIAAFECVYNSGVEPVVLSTLRHLVTDPDPDLQFYAVTALAFNDRSYVQAAIPVILNALDDPARQDLAIFTLGCLGEDAHGALPALLVQQKKLHKTGSAPHRLSRISTAILMVKGLMPPWKPKTILSQ